MAYKNFVELIGNTGATPEIKTFDSGKKVASFNLATSEYYKNEQGEKIEKTQWHTVKAWGKLAELIEKHVQKGDSLLIEGKLQHEQYEDKEGVKRYSTHVLADKVLFLTPREK